MKYRPSVERNTSNTDHIHATSCNNVARGLILSGNNKQYTISGNMLVGANSYDNLLCATRGYFNTRPCCNLLHTNTLTLADGRFSSGTRPAINPVRCHVKEKKKQPRPKPTKHCLPECKKRESNPEHYCFEMNDDYGSYSLCEKDDPVQHLDQLKCDCYDDAGVLHQSGIMNQPRKERLFTFPAALELSSACGELDNCRKFNFEYCQCRHCGDTVEVIVPDGCGFITLKQHRTRLDPERREPDDVDGKFECYSRTCVSLCPHPTGRCGHPRCRDGHHHRPDCGLDCRKILADVVCERKECIEIHEKKERKCFKPALCKPCDRRLCSERRCVHGYHHHHVCDIKNCPYVHRSDQSAPRRRRLPEPGQHIHKLSVLGFQKYRKPVVEFDHGTNQKSGFKKTHTKCGENCGPHCACCRNERQRRPHA